MKTTLIEELEQAADDAISFAEHLILSEGTQAAIDVYLARAKRLSARVIQYRRLVAQRNDEIRFAYDEGWQDALDLIDTPLD